ncbi:hypothetical protein S83_063259, partial [Arachis hypogaea]
PVLLGWNWCHLIWSSPPQTYISLHMSFTATTKKIFNDATFAKMKKEVRIINVARGG